MSAPLFTPGPWQCEPETDRPRPWVGRLCENRFAAMACGEDEAEAWANGRLIAAAPAMYEALAEAEACIIGESYFAALQQIRSALAKARGEQA